MSIKIGAKPESSFENPLGLLSDCHRRIERFLRQLIVITEQAQGGALAEEQRKALDNALRYFREAAPRHTHDEEESLFPKLRACESDAVQEAFAAIDALEADHQAADARHREVEELGQRWLTEGQLSAEETQRLAGVLTSLQLLYQTHIRVEDTQIFPLAGKVLNETDLKAVGREMAARRGIDLSKLPDLNLRCPTRNTPSDSG